MTCGAASVTGVQLLQVGLVAARPVGRLIGYDGTQHVEDPIETCLVHDVADTHEIEVAGRHPDHKVLLGDDAEHEVLAVLALDGPHLDVLDDGGPVVRVDDRFADGESHM